MRDIGYEEAEESAALVMEIFEHGKFEGAHLCDSRFRSALLQEATSRQIIPVAMPADADAGSDAAVEYEPDETEILSTLLPRNVTIQIFGALLENAASEQGASMTAMDKIGRAHV